MVERDAVEPPLYPTPTGSTKSRPTKVTAAFRGQIATEKSALQNELDSGISGIWLRARVEIGAHHNKSKPN